MKRIVCSLLVATLPFGSVLADARKSKNAKVTLVYQHELPAFTEPREDVIRIISARMATRTEEEAFYGHAGGQKP